MSEADRGWLTQAAADGFVGAQAALGLRPSGPRRGPAEVTVTTTGGGKVSGLFDSIGGEGGKVWPQPIGREASDATEAFEQIRARAMAISQWSLDEISANSLYSKIVQGLTTQARMQPDAAQAVAREIERLLGLLQDSAETMAAVAKLAGTKMVTMYEEPIREARSRRPAATSLGLKVN